MGTIQPELYIFGCGSISVIDFITQVLWFLKFLQEKFFAPTFIFRSSISQCMIYLLVHFIGQYLIYVYIIKPLLKFITLVKNNLISMREHNYKIVSMDNIIKMYYEI